jgi:hypothetical protein
MYCYVVAVLFVCVVADIRQQWAASPGPDACRFAAEGSAEFTGPRAEQDAVFTSSDGAA